MPAHEGEPRQRRRGRIAAPRAVATRPSAAPRAADRRPGTPLRLLVLEDDPDLSRVFGDYLEWLGYEVDRARTLAAARALLARAPAVALVDLSLPDGSGMELIGELGAKHPTSCALVVTAIDSLDSAIAAMRAGAVGYVRKPVDVAEVGTHIDHAVKTHVLRAEAAELRARLSATQRLAAVGRITGRIAHEINNPIAAIVSSTAVLRRLAATLSRVARRPERHGDGEGVPLEETLHDLDTVLDIVSDASLRAGGIVREVSRLAQRVGAPPERFSVDAVVEAAARAAAGECGEGGRALTLELRARCSALGDPLILSHVVANLVRNALHAVRHRPGAGRVEVRTSARRGQYVVEVVDDGCGISEETRARLFEPFFTTKPEGEGMGLGLALSLDVIASAGGKLDFTSTPGRGSTFTVALPCEQRPAAGEPGEEGPARLAP